MSQFDDDVAALGLTLIDACEPFRVPVILVATLSVTASFLSQTVDTPNAPPAPNEIVALIPQLKAVARALSVAGNFHEQHSPLPRES